MEDYLINIAITTLLELLKKFIPNDSSSRKNKSKWKRAFLKVFKAIAETYKDDEDFKTAN